MHRSLAASLVLLSLFTGCPKSTEQPPPSPQPAATTDAPAEGGEQAQCSVDADCVPASCCHPATCVPVAQQPNCTDQMCTMECRPETLDCGGRCACEAGSCTAKLGAP